MTTPTPSQRLRRTLIAMARGHIVLLCLLALAFSLRVVNIDAPPLGRHSWRQSDTAAVARNYHEQGCAFAFPRVDWGRPQPGYVETEFPLFPFVAAIGYAIAGEVHIWIPRLLAILGSLVGMIYLYRLIREEIDQRTAEWAAFFFAVLPFNVFFGRAIMPEAWMLSSGIAGVYYFARWTRQDSDRDLMLAWLCITLSCLLKLPMLHIGLPLLFLAWRRWGVGLFARAPIWLMGVGVLACVSLWYVHAYWIRLMHKASFGIGGSRKWANLQPLADREWWDQVFVEHIAKGHLTLPGTAIVLIGLLWPGRPRGLRLFDLWLIAAGVYMVIVAAGQVEHEYYQLPLVPVFCAYMGRAMRIPVRSLRPLLAALVVGLIALGVRSHARSLALENSATSPHMRLAALVAQHADEADLVIVANGHGNWNPMLLYLCHRKGWADHPKFMGPQSMRFRVNHGAQWLIGLHADLQRPADLAWLQRQLKTYEVVVSDEEIFMLRLRP